MNERLYLSSDDTAPIEPIEELSHVTPSRDVDAGGHRLPVGSQGTVVLVHGAGEAYCVEVSEPFHALVTVECGVVTPIPGESRADLIASLRARAPSPAAREKVAPRSGVG